MAAYPGIASGLLSRLYGPLPHIALPVVVFLSFFLPPFAGRGIVFACLIILTNYTCAIWSWPPDVGETRPIRYGLAGSWIFVLPAVERLLLHVPERDFWRLDANNAQDKEQTPSWSWSKARWAGALAITPRAVGWNFGSRTVNAKREAMQQRRWSRISFVIARVLRAMIAYLILDAVVLAASQASIPTTRNWDAVSIANIAFVETLMGLSVYSTMTLQFELVAAITVGLNLSYPEDWPPLFGNITECYTIANVWGSFWHGYIRQPVLGFSHALLSLFGIPRRSIAAYAVHLSTAFFISGFFHVVSLSVICPGHFPLRNLILDMAIFFLSQPLAAVAEALVIQSYRNLTSSKKSSDREAPKSGLRSSVWYGKASRLAPRIVGYIWVVSWFSFIGWWFIEPYIAVGVIEWPLPNSVWGAVFGIDTSGDW